MSFLNEFNLFAFAKRAKRPLILDGAMGSLLQQKGVEPHPQLWMSHANLIYHEKVLAIHREYIEAGADIITANTFRTNPSAAEHASKKLVKAALEIAKEAKGSAQILIAGSNSPAEDCYQKERTIDLGKLEYNHYKHIDLLIDSGCDFILNETQSHLDELRLICSYCSRNRIPFIVSLFFDNDLRLLSGEPLKEVLPVVWEHTPLAVGFNCIMPSVFRKLSRERLDEYTTGFYLNCGDGSYTDKDIKCGIHPDEYVTYTKEFLSLEPSFIGACCGSFPEHINKLKELFELKDANQDSGKDKYRS